MDSASPIATRTAGTISDATGTPFTLAMRTFKAENWTERALDWVCDGRLGFGRFGNPFGFDAVPRGYRDVQRLSYGEGPAA